MRPTIPIREACPVGVCNCEREQLAQVSDPDTRVLLLTRHEEKRLLDRLESLTSLSDLRHMQQRLLEQLGVTVHIVIGNNEVHTVKGIDIWIDPRPGLCSKVRKSIPRAIRKGLDQRHQIIYDLLDESSLFK